MRYAWKSVTRNFHLTIAVVAAVATLTFFLSVFTNSIQRNQEQLERIYEETTVNASITGYMDAPTASLSQEQYHTIVNSGFVKTSAAMIQQKVNGNSLLRALNDTCLEPDLEGWLPYVSWLDGYDETVLLGEEAVCLLPQQSKVQLGDTVSLKMNNVKDTAPLELLVVGLYGQEHMGSMQEIVYYCPLKTMEVYLSEGGQRVVYNKMEMELGNLARLTTFKTKMKELGLDRGTAQLVINDALLQQVTSQLRRHIRLLNTLLPILLTIVAGIGFGLSFLLMQGKRREAAVMRTLGALRVQVFGVFLSEIAMQAVTGILLGGLFAYLVLGETAFHLKYLALVLGCFLIGGARAIWNISGENVFNSMTARE